MKKAFGDVDILKGLVRDILGIHLEIEIAKSMLAEGLDIKLIVKTIGLTEDMILQ